MNENENIEELYKKHYYPNITRFYQILKENEIKKTLKEVKEFIALQGINQIHKSIIKRRNQ
jgi:effector-binding domain-containing protein